MNEAHVLIAAASLGAAFGLGAWTGADTDNEFFPNGVSVLFCLMLASSFLWALWKLVMNAL